MRSNRPGCLTGTGMVAALVTVLVTAGYAYARGGLMYNPGPLNTQGDQALGGVRSHAEIGGDCQACHTAPWEPATMTDRCTVCHVEIAGQMRDVTTLHGAVVHNDPSLGCRHCHPEHRGADAALTIMESGDFPHDAFGFSLNTHRLTSAGRPFTCDDCHQGDVTTFALTTCDTCHRQAEPAFMTAHTLSFASACLDCHDGVDRFSESFDHNVLAFQLTGAHAGAACVQCHTNARTLGDFAQALQDCYSCHWQEDAHQGRFGTDCAGCHNTAGWEEAAFDHALSGFPLTGAHVNLACEACHVNAQFSGLSATCVACHAEPESHAGQFGTDCAACHNTGAWTPAEFKGPHPFPLDHGGGATCATCHTAGFSTYTCYGCHEHTEAEVREEHLKEGIVDFQNCMECHPTGEEHEGEDR